jgi:hypothetical protein
VPNPRVDDGRLVAIGHTADVAFVAGAVASNSFRQISLVSKPIRNPDDQPTPTALV